MKDPRVSKDFEYVPFCMACVLALILAMACLSKKNNHPDEFVHVRAAAYYHDHWIPPKVCASGTEHTYSSHGISRLNTHEIFYFFAGKFSRLLSFVSMDDEYLKCRLLNVLLFFVVTPVLYHKSTLSHSVFDDSSLSTDMVCFQLF